LQCAPEASPSIEHLGKPPKTTNISIIWQNLKNSHGQAANAYFCPKVAKNLWWLTLGQHRHPTTKSRRGICQETHGKDTATFGAGDVPWKVASRKRQLSN